MQRPDKPPEDIEINGVGLGLVCFESGCCVQPLVMTLRGHSPRTQVQIDRLHAAERVLHLGKDL